MNKVILKGNCGKDPEIVKFDNGGMVAQFSLATTERGFKTRDGRDIPDRTDWHNIVVKKSGLAGVCEQYVKKGTPLLIVGKIQTREYTDNSGVKRYITEINVDELELLGGNRSNSAAPAPEPEPEPAHAQEQPVYAAPPVSESADPNDDLPF